MKKTARGGAEGSLIAYRSIVASLQGRELAVLSVIMRRPRGATMKEVAKELEVEFHTVSGRAKRLRQLNLVRNTGERHEGCAVLIAVRNPQQFSLLEAR